MIKGELTASEALSLSNNVYRQEAINYGYENTYAKIREAAANGKRDCIVSFWTRPGRYEEFMKKFPNATTADYDKEYNIENELKCHFRARGYQFKLVTDDICGGVRQAPYWIVCW